MWPTSFVPLGVDARAVHHVSLVIDEILTNVATHGGNPDAPASVAIEVRTARVFGEIGDWGTPFDPRIGPGPDFGAPLEERKHRGAWLAPGAAVDIGLGVSARR